MIIGRFMHDSKTGEFFGDIVTLQFAAFDVRFIPIIERQRKGPNFRLEASDGWLSHDIGAAWERITPEGKRYIDVTLECPSLTAPIFAVLLIEPDSDMAALRWRRREPGWFERLFY